jgi:hypothetical protein
VSTHAIFSSIKLTLKIFSPRKYAPHVHSGCGNFSEVRTPRSLRLREFFGSTHPMLSPSAEIFQKFTPHVLSGCGNFSKIRTPDSLRLRKFFKNSHPCRGETCEHLQCSRLTPAALTIVAPVVYFRCKCSTEGWTTNIHAATMGNNSCTRQQQKKRTITAPAPSRSRFGRRQLSHQTLHIAPFS